MFPVVFLNLLLPLSFLTRSGFFNGMSEIFKSGALNHFILSRFILLILSVPRNPNSSYLPLSVSLNTLPCDLIALTGGLAFFLLMIRTLAAESSFWLGRAYSFLNFLKSFICLLDRNSDYAGVNISLNIFFSLSFLNAHAVLCLLFFERTDSFSASNFSSSRNFCTLGDFNCHQPLWESKGTSDPRGKEVLDWIISFDFFHSITLTHQFFSIVPLAVAALLTSLLLPSLLQYVAPGKCFGTCLPIVLTVSYSPVFRPNERTPSFNFQKARWDHFAFHFDSHCPSAKNFLLPLLLLSSLLWHNAARFSISFGRIKRQPQASRSPEVEEAVSKRRKAFIAAHRSDEDRQAYISTFQHASSVVAKPKAEAYHATC